MNTYKTNTVKQNKPRKHGKSCFLTKLKQIKDKSK